MTARVKLIIDCVEWVIIITLSILCIYIYMKGKSAAHDEIVSEQENTYMKIYDSQKLETLKKENKELYSIIDSLKNVESGIEIRYRYLYKTDTIVVTETNTDSLYHYTYDNDTVKYNIDIMAKELRWHKSQFELNDKFTMVNSEDNNRNKVVIKHSPNTEITGTDVWHKKENFKDRFYIGPSVGIGYGIFNKKPDVYVGISAGFKF